MPEAQDANKTDAQIIEDLREQVASLTTQLANAKTRIELLERPPSGGNGFIGRHKF